MPLGGTIGRYFLRELRLLSEGVKINDFPRFCTDHLLPNNLPSGETPWSLLIFFCKICGNFILWALPLHRNLV